VFLSIAGCRIFQFVLNIGARVLNWRKAIPLEGAGSITKIPELLKQTGVKKPIVVTDPGLMSAGVAPKILSVLDAAGITYALYDKVEPNPTVNTVNAIQTKYLAEGCNGFIAIGGGSSMDAAKGAAARVKFPNKTVNQLGGLLRVWKKIPPFIAVPTTAGTGSETTIAALITDSETHHKYAIMDLHLIPLYAVLDPELTVGLPPHITAATGMDALTHAIEGYITKGAWELTDMVEIKSIQLIAANLRASVLENDPKAAENMGLGQYIAGMGYSNVGLGAVHGMGHPLGGFYDIPHGVANALLLPYVMAFNAPACGEKFRDIGRAMKIPGIDEMSLEDAQKATVAAVRQLSIDVGVPEKLHELGVKKEDLPALAEAAFKDVCTPGNPREVTEADLLALYEEAF